MVGALRSYAKLLPSATAGWGSIPQNGLGRTSGKEGRPGCVEAMGREDESWATMGSSGTIKLIYVQCHFPWTMFR
jgi:hypothetical protein